MLEQLMTFLSDSLWLFPCAHYVSLPLLPLLHSTGEPVWTSVSLSRNGCIDNHTRKHARSTQYTFL